MSVSSDTLTEYEICMQSAERRVFHLLHSPEWQIHTEKKSGSVWKMRCNVTENNMFRFEGIIPNRSPVEVAVMVHPEGIHRCKWDSQSGGTPLVARITENTSIIRHDTKSRLMGLISAREAVDLCRFSTDPEDGTRSVVMVSVTHPSAPLREGIVRVHTHPSLLVMSPSGKDTKVTSIIQAEMHLMGVPAGIMDSLVPKGILSFFDDLRAYSSKDLKLNLNQSLTGWVP
ncbi:START domain protein [Ancylostoma ceylanicum]|uniref:START domain protein n=2 Tax=Ancylostoma ceylanicum TaxID=53326 RepID=A0A0D6M2Q5_9BILA|nr:START domain protein [Ancylostoma ceylanicum]EYB90476.1 hypothetical protein Y032_0219g2453 [Ancylostoma ceylanicum]